MGKVLVTGGGGFLGSAIVRQLVERGERVRILQRRAVEWAETAGVEQFRGSLTDEAAVRLAVAGCTEVIHTAALAGVWGRRRDFFEVNLEGTRNLLRAMEKSQCGILVHCSTPSVVFTGEPFEGADEQLPYGRNWLCDYAESKARAEEAVLEWAKRGKAKAVALRPHLIFGRGDPHLLPTVIERARSGRLRIIGDGQNRVDITAVGNAGRAHVQAMDWLRSGGEGNRAYFLSQGRPVLLWQWINEILESVGVAPLRQRVGFRTAYRVGSVFEFIYRNLGKWEVPPMTRFVATELAKSHWFSIEAAKKDFGYNPEAESTAMVMADYVAAYRAGETPVKGK